MVTTMIARDTGVFVKPRMGVSWVMWRAWLQWRGLGYLRRIGGFGATGGVLVLQQCVVVISAGSCMGRYGVLGLQPYGPARDAHRSEFAPPVCATASAENFLFTLSTLLLITARNG